MPSFDFVVGMGQLFCLLVTSHPCLVYRFLRHLPRLITARLRLRPTWTPCLESETVLEAVCIFEDSRYSRGMRFRVEQPQTLDPKPWIRQNPKP